MGIVSRWECLMPSHKTNRLERVGRVQWQKLDWKGGSIGYIGNVVCSERLWQCQIIGFGKNIPINARKGISLPSGHAWEGDGSGRPGAAAGKPLLPSLAALPDKSQRESQPWKTLSL